MKWIFKVKDSSAGDRFAGLEEIQRLNVNCKRPMGIPHLRLECPLTLWRSLPQCSAVRERDEP
jgi:hypothetical protein